MSNVREFTESHPAASVRLISNDGEEFVIRKAVLAPCIELTAIVREKVSRSCV